MEAVPDSLGCGNVLDSIKVSYYLVWKCKCERLHQLHKGNYVLECPCGQKEGFNVGRGYGSSSDTTYWDSKANGGKEY